MGGPRLPVFTSVCVCVCVNRMHYWLLSNTLMMETYGSAVGYLFIYYLVIHSSQFIHSFIHSFILFLMYLKNSIIFMYRKWCYWQEKSNVYC